MKVRSCSLFATALLAATAGTTLARQDAKPAGQPTGQPVGDGSTAAAAGQPVVSPSTDGAERPADATPTPIIVRGVQGSVAVQRVEKGPRKPVKVNDILPEGSIITTGAGGMVQIQVGIGQVFTIDKLSVVKISEAIATAGKEKTTVDMQYGRVKFDVTSTAIANDVQIASPDTTLAVKGTSGGMEAMQGFPTFAFGGETNKGRFTVTFPQKVVATIVGSEGADSDNPDPAALASKDSFVEIGDGMSRYGDEIEFVFDFATVFQRVFGTGDAQGIGVAPALTGTFAYDEVSGNIILFDPFPDDPKAQPLVAGTPTNFNANAAFVGAALQRTAAGTQFLRLESDGSSSSRLLGFILGFGTRPAVELATFSTVLNGLATLGDSLYSVEYPVGALGTPSGTPTFHLDRLSTLNTSEGSTLTSMQFGTRLEGGLGAFTSRGTLLVAGRLPEFTNIANGNSGFLGSNAMILEVDPRINFLSRALSDVTDDFAVVDFDTVISDDLNPLFEVSINDQTITGLSQSRAVFGGGVGVGSNNLVIQINLSANVDGTPRDISLIVNGDSARVPGDVPLRLVGPSPQSVRDFATETVTPAASVLLSAAPANVDSFVPSLFGQMAFSQAALASGVVERLARNAVITTSVNPTNCMFTAEINNLPTLLASHTMQRSGMGASIFDFRAGLPQGHPCLAPGQMGGGLSGETFFVFDLAAGTIFERDLVNNSIARFTEINPPADILDTTVYVDPATGHRLLLGLVNEEVDEGGKGSGNVLSLTRVVGFDLTAGGTDFTTRGTFSNGDQTDVTFTGLTSFGASLYASGFTSVVEGDSDSGIYALNLTSNTFNLVVDPGIFIGVGLAAARSRGTIFAMGSSFDNVLSGFSNSILVEVDPRTNYLANVFSGEDGDFTPGTTTINNNGVDIGTLQSVIGLTYVGNTLVINALTSTGSQVILQYTPAAANTPTDPRVRRLDQVPMGNMFFGLAGNSSGNPQASVTLSNPSGPLEPAGVLPATFAAMAYSVQAANSLAFQGLIKDRIAGTSVDPAACIASSELNGQQLRTAISSHVAQRSGVSQAIRAFRDGLPSQHPCARSNP